MSMLNEETSFDFSGRVAVVTGAGRGIGRETALALARRGASVLVNDYGGGPTTLKAGTTEVAQQVVDEIHAAGGFAVADGSSVGSGSAATAIISHAMDAFGRVDVLVNNAGGATHAAFDELDDDQIEGQLATLLIGPYMLMRRAWPIMRKQGFGRIVNVLSSALLGVELHAAYCTAKSGLIGLINASAFEGAPLGIAVNGVWPVAMTRLNEKLAERDEDLHARMMQFRPRQVAEAITYLSASECDLNGEMFCVGGGRVARIGIFNTSGYVNREITAEDLAGRIEEARDMTDAVLLTSARQEVARFPVEMP